SIQPRLGCPRKIGLWPPRQWLPSAPHSRSPKVIPANTPADANTIRDRLETEASRVWFPHDFRLPCNPTNFNREQHFSMKEDVMTLAMRFLAFAVCLSSAYPGVADQSAIIL